jgi:hypothetical protein
LSGPETLGQPQPDPYPDPSFPEPWGYRLTIGHPAEDPLRCS